MVTFTAADSLGNRIIQRRSQLVEILGVDSDRLEKDSTFKDGYAFYIKLSSEPDEIWQEQLAKWDSALASMKRKITIEKDNLRLIFVYGDNMRLCADYVTSLVNWVNARVAEHNQTLASLEEVKQNQKQLDKAKEEFLLQELKKLKAEPDTSVSEMTIEKLTAAYENDSTEYERYRNSVIKLTGIVNRIERNYLVLTDKLKPTKSVLCVFDKSRFQELKRIKTGQLITVQGEFEGSVLQVSMRHCSLEI